MNIGWIGLGNMGDPMATNLIKAGFNVAVYNRTLDKTKPFEQIGAKVCLSQTELCIGSDIIFTMLSNDAAVIEVYEQLLGCNVTGKLFINMSTIAPQLALSLDKKCNAMNAGYLDAPVSGSVKPAADATLLILSGGNKEHYDRAKPLFDKLGKLSLLLGEAGAGTAAKLAINYYMSVMIGGLAETVLFAEKNGIERATMMEIINQSACGSPMSNMKTTSIVKDNYPAAFPLKYMFKDVGLARKEGLHTGLCLATQDMYQAAINDGFAEEDLMAVIKAIKM